MKLLELFEDDTKHVTFMFGRLNPPTLGHGQLLDTVAGVGGDYRIFVSQSQDPKKNPLDYSDKIKFIKKMFPKHAKNVVEDSSLNTVVKVAAHLYDQGYRHATFVAGSDRLDDMKKLLTTYNGVEGKSHGFYDFETLDFRSSGEREDGAEGVAGISASMARAAAANGDLDGFAKATGAGNDAEDLFNAVRKGMGITESMTNEVIRKVKGGYRLLSKKTGKNLGTYPTRAGAVERERQVQYFKHANEDKDIEETCKYGRYYCSTDKKWKCRTGPKQTRSS